MFKLHNKNDFWGRVQLKKYGRGSLNKTSPALYGEMCDLSAFGSFAFGDVIVFSLNVPRILGIRAVNMRINMDGFEDKDLPLSFKSTTFGEDIYEISLDTQELCGEFGNGLFYYEFVFISAQKKFHTDTPNNLDFEISESTGRRFHMLIYEKNFEVPDWFCGGVMYQIFPDRFCKGSGKVNVRSDVVINSDWYGGTPEFAAYPGGFVKTNDFFGGNLWGIAEKLDYLSSLGVTCIYLNPIFEAYSNHKYDTGDYMKIDGMFGGEAAFDNLLEKAKEAGIRIILDGVFNHTGSQSLYFDKSGSYGGIGAYRNVQSPYKDWYIFKKHPNEYEAWWGIDILPRLNPENESCRRFFTGEDGVAAHYIRRGADGFRLDVADELSDTFLNELRASIKNVSPDALIIGEVWENAADKISYGHRRSYLRGFQLDSVMNYPLREGIIDFLRNSHTKRLADTLKEIYSSYPKAVSDALMNVIGTHDTARILTVLGSNYINHEVSNSILAAKHFDEKEREKGIRLLKIAATLQYTVYGVPSVYYGDEAGMEGYHDPFCRMPYPWGREAKELLEFYNILGKIRRHNPVFKDGIFKILYLTDTVILYSREKDKEAVLIAANASAYDEDLPLQPGIFTNLLTSVPFDGKIKAFEAIILKKTGRMAIHGTYKKNNPKAKVKKSGKQGFSP